jgi:hypothetical protein
VRGRLRLMYGVPRSYTDILHGSLLYYFDTVNDRR